MSLDLTLYTKINFKWILNMNAFFFSVKKKKFWDLNKMAYYSARKRNELIHATVYGFMPSEKR